ncbi:MAG TPA: hypothetical protein VFF33_08855 [Ignavibacteriaceae bacterium]|nr:hypothetical protein [Ignavibacteriaceae bacterium]
MINKIEFEEIGSIELKCPYCKKNLEKFPIRKTECKNCGKYYYIRTRPLDHLKVIVTEEQMKFIENQWSQKYRIDEIYNEYLEVQERFDKIRSSIKNQSNVEPSDNEIFLKVYDELLDEFYDNYNWGLYRNIKLKIARSLEREIRINEAFQFFLEVFYLDVNGPNNCGTKNQKILKDFPPFDGYSFIPPGIIYSLNDLMAQLRIKKNDVENIFIEVAKKLSEKIRILPVNPEKAWEIYEKDIFED